MDCTRPRATASGSAAVFVTFWLIALAVSDVAAVPSGPPPDKTLTDTLRVLDHAIHLLGDSSSDYRKVLLDAIAAFPGNADDKLRADVRTFLARAPEPGSNEFRCSADFVRSRARLALLRLSDALRREYVGPVQPAVCYAVPYALDLSQAQRTGGWIDIYGYDFDQVAPQMVLVTRDGYRDVTAALVARSHYHLAFKLDAARMSPESVSLGLTWGHLIHHSIALIQSTSSLCSVRVESIPAGRTISYSAPQTGVDGVLRRPGTPVWADATLDYSSNKLEATICLATGDPAGRDAFFSGCTVEFLYTTDADREIEAVFGPLSSQVSGGRGRGTGAVANSTHRGPVVQWAFGGHEPGTLEQGDIAVTARLNEIRLVSVEGGVCVSPLAYLEARRTTVLDSVTRQALDPQLEKIDPAVLRLRPRFALPIR
jgi:hypothetical protein